ncbi:L-seryl-tRNA(Sec) selenium transferase [Acidicapsa dinghuensis]|uniref:L-seryl-tRNA(Sec) selenium transferase n=1 Tax=Acidicapsa dinghuensis TaxID=2218256 RepID=A0ABW1EC41_9BACT|nr:L-seryl-tRNA(Sec) selenium transferase [Acidicapsa dinghuensis]
MTLEIDSTGSFKEMLYRELPSVSDVLLDPRVQRLKQTYSHGAVVNAVRAAIEEIRCEITRIEHSQSTLISRIAQLPETIESQLLSAPRYSLRRVVNATGVVLHTNLGRSPLSRAALDHIAEIAGGYSNLEFDLERGERGKRDQHIESLLLTLLSDREERETLAETYGATIVNNCAAATYLALHALAKGKEVIVSRGELVEIGGGFRIPEILKESGALLREIGTTNRTKVADYENALSANTGLILRVHQSNFSMDGFVERPSLEDLTALGKRANIPVFEDHGTGLLHALEPYGIQGEHTWAESLSAGCDLVAVSGDKLLGGPQCGILTGNRQLVDQIRRDSLFRTFRVDKLGYAALEATLMQYVDGSFDGIPILKTIATHGEEIEKRCRSIADVLDSSRLSVKIKEVESLVGGGTTPKARLKSVAISLRHADLTAQELLGALRRLDPPVIARIEEDHVLLDLRTVEPSYDKFLAETINVLSSSQVTAGRNVLG